MSDDGYVYATAAVILTTLIVGVFRKSFDPFAPHWLFLTGYAQVYVVQAITAFGKGICQRKLCGHPPFADSLRAVWP